MCVISCFGALAGVVESKTLVLRALCDACTGSVRVPQPATCTEPSKGLDKQAADTLRPALEPNRAGLIPQGAPHASTFGRLSGAMSMGHACACFFRAVLVFTFKVLP